MNNNDEKLDKPMKSEVPKMNDFMNPILEYANQRRSFALREIADAMAEHFNLSPEARAELTEGGNIDRVYDRIGWSITHLKHAGFLQQPGRGRYEITDAGREAVSSSNKISVSYLTQNVPAYQQWKLRKPMPDIDKTEEKEWEHAENKASQRIKEIAEEVRLMTNYLENNFEIRMTQLNPNHYAYNAYTLTSKGKHKKEYGPFRSMEDAYRFIVWRDLEQNAPNIGD